jgi:hypothetical protein
MSHNVTIFANLDLDVVKDPEADHYDIPQNIYGVLNGITEDITLRLNSPKYPSNKLVFTVNGIDGVGYRDNTFNLNKIYYQGQKIYFTVKCKSENEFPIKWLPRLILNNTPSILNNTSKLSANEITISVKDANGNTITDSIITNFGTLTAHADGGFYKGYFIIDTPVTDIRITGRANVIDEGEVLGESTTFNIYQSGGLYNFRKTNEDNNQKQNYKDILYQPNLIDKSRFFDNFLGQIVGDDSDENSLGVKIYEKISNFVSNNSDIQYCNVNNLINHLKMIDDDVVTFADVYPASLKRIVDFVSVNMSSIKSQKNLYQFNFDPKGFSSNPKYGINLGDEITISTVLSGGENFKPIIAHEISTNKYFFINTDPTYADGFRFLDETNKLYTLSAYNYNWGWRLVLPNEIGNYKYVLNESDGFFLDESTSYRLLDESFSSQLGYIENMFKYYKFYNFVDTFNGNTIKSFIDGESPYCNLTNLSSYDEFNRKDGIVEEMIYNNLVTKTNLIV